MYRLLVDFDLVSPPLDLPNLRPPPAPPPDSKSFLVSLTVSGAGNSLSFTPKRRPADGRFWEDFFALLGGCLGEAGCLGDADCLGEGCLPPPVFCFTVVETDVDLAVERLLGVVVAFFSTSTRESLTRAGEEWSTLRTGGVLSLSRGGNGGGLSCGGGPDAW